MSNGAIESTSPMRGWLFKYGWYVLIAVIILLLPTFVSPYIRSMVIKILVYGIFALSLNLLYGYTGLFSLGHAAYFGVGAYTAAILTTRLEIESFWILIIASIVVATIAAAFFGFIALRVSGIYFLLVTLAIGQLLYSVGVKWKDVTGGFNGIAGIMYPDMGVSWLKLTPTTFYYLIFIVFVICFILLYLIGKSPFGRALKGIYGDERRMKHLGYNTWLYKYIAFVLGGVFAGVAGSIYTFHSGVVGPGFLSLLTSAMVLLMVILGSDQVFWGPALGAAVIVILEHVSSLYIPDRWPLVLGAVFILAVLFLRGGLGIRFVRIWEKVQDRYYGRT